MTAYLLISGALTLVCLTLVTAVIIADLNDTAR